MSSLEARFGRWDLAILHRAHHDFASYGKHRPRNRWPLRVIIDISRAVVIAFLQTSPAVFLQPCEEFILTDGQSTALCEAVVILDARGAALLLLCESREVSSRGARAATTRAVGTKTPAETSVGYEIDGVALLTDIPFQGL